MDERTNYSRYLRVTFTPRSVTYSLRDTNILSLHKPLTTTYGLRSFKYIAAKYWNSLPDAIKNLSNITDFKRAIQHCNFH